MGATSREPVQAGDTRSRFGWALDRWLPMPEQRKAFRRWRHGRPFWAGLFVIVGGLILISYPLGPLPAMMAIAAAAFTGIALGLILITGGLFFWFAPHQRTFIAIVLMILSVLSLVASNFGGFLFGMAFGMVGSAMAFGWMPGADYKRKGAAGLAIVGLLLAGISTIGVTQPRAFALSGAAAPADRPDGRPPLPVVGCGSTNVTAGTLQARDVRVYGTTFVKDGCGNTIEVVDLYIPTADLTDYQVSSPGSTFRIDTGLHIERIELETPSLNAEIDITGLVAEQLGIPADLLPPALRPKIGPIPITPALIRTLQSLGLATRENPFVIKRLDAAPATWIQPIIRGGDVYLTDARLRIVGKPAPIG